MFSVFTSRSRKSRVMVLLATVDLFGVLLISIFSLVFSCSNPLFLKEVAGLQYLSSGTCAYILHRWLLLPVLFSRFPHPTRYPFCTLQHLSNTCWLGIS